MDIIQYTKSQLQLSSSAISATLQLLEEGATVPFIARYRKERTGSLDETQILAISKYNQQFQEIIKRKEYILTTVASQNQLSSQLKQRILSCWDPTQLEDLYLPFKTKRKTRATIAKEKGLEPLALHIFRQSLEPLNDFVPMYIKGEVKSVDEALLGTRDIIAEWVSVDSKVREYLRKVYQDHALIYVKVIPKKEAEAGKYKDYFNFSEKISSIPSHRLLAVLRGVKEGYLRSKVYPDQDKTLQGLFWKLIKNNGASGQQVKMAIEDAYKRLLHPSMENEILQEAKSKADDEAIEIFAKNLSALLLSPPLGEKSVLAIDPGFRTGCKIVAIDMNGIFQANATIYPHPPLEQRLKALQTVQEFIAHYRLDTIAIGNGTAGRETFDWLRNNLTEMKDQIYLVNESGASIYSASTLAREEFPDLDLTVRGAISIGRRLLDPMAELIKIDPKSIGIGQYQHDVDQRKLKERLDQVVISCVNKVGVNLNTAGVHLLTYISGLGPVLAKNIISFRQKNGGFQTRTQLLNVPKLGPKAFEQAAGFLRIKDGENVLDDTGVHPERYALVNKIAQDHQKTIHQWIQHPDWVRTININSYLSVNVGRPTLEDIFREIARPGLDPRGLAKSPAFNDHIRTIEDLQTGMILTATVTNLTKFGAFVDLGIKENGLIHISEITNRFIKSPEEVLQIDQQVTVKVIEIDLSRKRIQLSMKRVQT